MVLLGGLYASNSGKNHYTDVIAHGETQMHHSRGSFEENYPGGGSCSGPYNFVYANGEARHKFNDIQCS